MEWIRPFAELGASDVELVGGKNASLGELLRELAPLGVRVPDGFAVDGRGVSRTSSASRSSSAPIRRAALAACERTTSTTSCGAATQIRELIVRAPLPRELEEEIDDELPRALASTTARTRPTSPCARRPPPRTCRTRASPASRRASSTCAARPSSATPCARRSRASSRRARSATALDMGFDHMQVALSVGVQKMVRSDLASAGVIFTLDPETGHRGVVLVTSSFGLGESVVQGRVAPDQFYVHKATLDGGLRVRSSGRSSAPRRCASSTTTTGTGRCTSEPRARRASARAGRSPTTTCSTLARWAVRDRGALLARCAAPTRRWTSSGPRTASPASSSSCRRGRRRCTASRAAPTLATLRARGRTASRSSRASRSATASASARVRVIRDPQQIGEFRAGRDPRHRDRPIPTGSRS